MRLGQWVRIFAWMVAIVGVFATLPVAVRAAPYAAIVIDGRSGEVLYSNNADTRLHPASLTKMMTLYIAFEAIRRGEITLDTKVKISSNAASEPPSKLGLKAGQTIALRYLIRAAAVKSANDAATAIGEAISGNEADFAARMNRTAKAIGMKSTTFKNANGLTASGHLSTARDMNTLGRRLFYDYPEYYNIFSRRQTDAGMAKVNNTNRRFLDAYKGSDGIKTGYTSAAGFNLTASAERGSKRIIATVFGGKSTAHRNAKMAELLDLGFGNAPANVAVKKPAEPVYDTVAQGNGDGRSAGKTIRLVTAVSKSLRPKARPGTQTPPPALVAAISEDINAVIASLQETPAEMVKPEARPEIPAQAEIAPASETVLLAEAAPVPETEATPVPETLAVQTETALAEAVPTETAPDTGNTVLLAASPAPRARPESPSAPETAPAETLVIAAIAPAPRPSEPEVVTRISTSGGRHWGVNVGRFPSRGNAERALLKTALIETATLSDSLRKIVQRSGGYDANFMGLSQEQADLACRRLQARAVQCFTIGP